MQSTRENKEIRSETKKGNPRERERERELESYREGECSVEDLNCSSAS